MKKQYRLKSRQRGAVVVIGGLSALVLFGFMGLAVNLSQAYDLRTELQNRADASALAGAKELNGTLAGINAAVASAKATALANRFNFSESPALADANISFGDHPDTATWRTIAQAQAAPDGLLFIKVDTGTQTSVVSSVANLMAVTGLAAPLTSSASAVAGRYALRVAPIAVCAIETTKYGQIPHPPLPPELKEFGFRRGIGYNIVKINPLGSASLKFLLNPIDIPPGPGDTSACTPSNSSEATVAPFLCSGSASIITTLPGYVYVNTGYSAAVGKQINSRFNDYGGGSAACTPGAAPPDANVQEYAAPGTPAPDAPSNANGVPANWMSPAPTQQSISLTGGSPGASGVPKSPLSAATEYGPLWTYNRAVQYAPAPPAGGYIEYAPPDWPLLYPVTTAPPPTALSYPGTTPYQQPVGTQFSVAPATNGPGVGDRRVLNVAIVDCSTLSSSSSSCATIQVLGIGKFFMSVRADLPAALGTEFAGLVPDSILTADIRLYH